MQLSVFKNIIHIRRIFFEAMDLYRTMVGKLRLADVVCAALLAA